MQNPTNFETIQENSIRHLLITAMEKNKIAIRHKQLRIMTKIVLFLKINDQFDYTAADIGRHLKIKHYMYITYKALILLEKFGIVRYYRKIGRQNTYQLVSWKDEYQNDELENKLKTMEKIKV